MKNLTIKLNEDSQQNLLDPGCLNVPFATTPNPYALPPQMRMNSHECKENEKAGECGEEIHTLEPMRLIIQGQNKKPS